MTDKGIGFLYSVFATFLSKQKYTWVLVYKTQMCQTESYYSGWFVKLPFACALLCLCIAFSPGDRKDVGSIPEYDSIKMQYPGQYLHL